MSITSRRRPARSILVALLVAAGLGSGRLVAADGDPLGGSVLYVDLGGPDTDAVAGVAVQPDGRIILAGTSSTGASTWTVVVARQLADGNPDPSFGSGGQVVNPFGFAHSAAAAAVHLLADGRILVAGTVDWGGGDQDFFVGRLLATGAPDPSFAGGSGSLDIFFDLGGDHTDSLSAMAVDRSGRALLVGSVDVSPTDSDLAVARVTTDGQLDSSFSGDGKLTISASATGPDLGLALAVHPAGGLVVGGAAWSTDLGGHFSMALARVLANGTLDPSFGSGGVVVFPYPLGGTNNAIAWGLGVWPDGEIVVAGDVATAANEWQWVLFRFSASGSWFQGTIGRFCEDGTPPCPAAPQDSPRALLLQGDGKILIAGFGPGLSGTTDFGLCRVQRDLVPDWGFGVVGCVNYDFAGGIGGDADVGRAVALDHDGRIVVAGSAEWNGLDTDFAWERFDSSYIFADGFDWGDLTARWSQVVP